MKDADQKQGQSSRFRCFWHAAAGVVLLAAFYPQRGGAESKETTASAGGRHAAGQLTVRFTFREDDVTFAAWKGFDVVSLRGGQMPEDEPGTPWLPAKYVNVLIPAGATATRVSTDSDEILLRRGLKLMPVQPPVPIGSASKPLVMPKAEVYAETAKRPAASASPEGRTGRRRGWASVPVRLNPLRYVPASGELYRAREIAVTVEYRAGPAVAPASDRHQDTFRRMARNMAANPDAPDAAPARRAEPGRGAALMSVDAASTPAAGTVAATGPCDYLIVTSQALKPAFQRLADQRAAFNRFSAEVVTTEWISANYPGVRPSGGTDEQTKIRECIQDYVNNRGTLYVVLGGDSTIVPDRDCFVMCAGETEMSMPTDHYYAGLDGTWDEDADGIYGESNYQLFEDEGDLEADVFVGRIPVRDASQAAAYIGKVTAYETALRLDVLPKFMMSGTMLWDSYSGTDRPKDAIPDGHLSFTNDSHLVVSDAEMWIRRAYRDSVANAGWTRTVGCTFDTLTSWDTALAGDYPASPANLIRRYSEGWNFVISLTHGSIDALAHENGNFSTSSALSLTGPVLFFYTAACTSGAFDLGNPALSEAMLINPNGGSLVYLGCSRYNWGYNDPPPADGYSTGGTGSNYQRQFLGAAFSSRIRSVGEAFFAHKAVFASASESDGSYRWVQFGLNLQGDPALIMIPGEPELTIEHTPLPSTFETNVAYEVRARIQTQVGIDTNRLMICWNTTGSTNEFQTNLMARVTNYVYAASIPAQQAHTDVYYYLSFETNGLAWTDPTNAPAELHHFGVTERADLTVTGSPVALGAPTPSYGTHAYPSGEKIVASALPTSPAEGTRHGVVGWNGSGSVPASGATNWISFSITNNSLLDWRWQVQHSLRQVSTVPGLLATDTWWVAASTAQTVTAAATVALGSTNYGFAGWRLEGARMGDAGGVAVNPVTGIPMTTSRVATAFYLPEYQDQNGNGIADWWEHYYFGDTNVAARADSDADGFTDYEEFRDRTNPRDPGHKPAPPVFVQENPLSNPMGRPAPWRVSVTVTDNCAVAGVSLWWSRNSGGWQETYMAPAGGNVFTSSIPEPGTNGDTFVYLIQAEDGLGLATVEGPESFRVAYPVAACSPASLEGTLLQPGQSTNVWLRIDNRGNYPLAWDLAVEHWGLSDDAESGPGQVTHGGQKDLWHISERRSHSPSHAWYLGSEAGGTYEPSTAARLQTPPLYLSRSAQMTFWHWIESELDQRHPRHAWDGGVVLISTNAGAAFEPIAPVGGYPYQSSYWQNPQWPEGTPCFAGTGGWEQATFDLTPYGGQEALIRFEFRGDDNTQYEGWYIDDVQIACEAGNDDPWLAVSRTNGVLAESSVTNISVSLDTAGMPTGDRAAFLRLTSNDPCRPTNSIPVSLRVRSPPGLAGLTAAQEPAGGLGLVTVSNAVYDIDGEPCALELQYSADSGVSWSDAWVVSATSSVGGAWVEGGFPPRVLGIPTGPAGRGPTNWLRAAWATRLGGESIGLCRQTLLRARIWDGLFWSEARTSAPFVVDNQPPGIPGLVKVKSHKVGTWSTNRHVRLEWTDSSDGDGTGVAGYGYGATNGAGLEAPVTVMTTNLWADVDVGADGVNLWAGVRAVDRHGNAGSTVSVGPLWIDGTPPAADLAWIQVANSECGPYVMEGAVTSWWGGFVDELSGLAAYFYSLHNGGGTTNGWRAEEGMGIVSGVVAEQTNRLYVWAEDAAGGIGAAASVPVLVVSERGDYDGDGLSSGAEEVAGTDASDPGSVLAFRRVTRTAGGVAMEWQGLTGRVYGVEWRAPLDGTWVPVPGFTNVPGHAAPMVHTTDVHQAGERFYRIHVRRP